MENDGGNKRMKEMPTDRLSALPDGILLHILSFLGYDLKQNEAAITSVLSKRWQFLWSELPILNFCHRSWDVEKTRDFVSWIHRTIILRSGSFNLEKFKVEFMYDERYNSDVNVWVRFAVRNNVKKLSLLLRTDVYFYTLPQVLYSHSSLACLYLRRCIVAPQLKIEWPCLTELTVKDAELHDDVIQTILSGCPVLCRLELNSCWGFKRLDVISKALHELMVYDFEYKNNFDFLEISAPYVRSLDVSFSPKQKKLRLINVQSLDTVAIHFSVYDNSVEVILMKNTVEILEKVQHAKELILGGLFIKVLSRLALNGWRLPQSRRKSLVIDTLRNKNSIPGILALLEASPNIDTLLIECADSFQKTAMAWVPAEKNDLDCDLLNLKIVRLLDFADPNLAGEPMLTMARILLKRATSLEKMKIKALESLTEFPSEFAKMSETVLGYPRSSEKAVVILRQ